MVKTARIIQSEWYPGVESSYGFTYPEKMERAVAKRRAEYFAGRYLSRLMLEDLGLAPEFIGSRDRIPLWPDGMRGSITHTKGYVAVLGSTEGGILGVGMDWERSIPQETWDSIHSRIASEEEEDLCPVGMDASLWGSLIFSLKESIYKALFPSVGRYFGFEAAAIKSVDLGQGLLEFEIREDLTSQIVKGTRASGRFVMFENTCLTWVIWRGG